MEEYTSHNIEAGLEERQAASQVRGILAEALGFLKAYQRLHESFDIRRSTMKNLQPHAPLELNPYMPKEGGNIQEHIARKYGDDENICVKTMFILSIVRDA